MVHASILPEQLKLHPEPVSPCPTIPSLPSPSSFSSTSISILPVFNFGFFPHSSPTYYVCRPILENETKLQRQMTDKASLR